MDGQMNEQMDRKSKPRKVERGKGTAYHLMFLDYLFLFPNNVKEFAPFLSQVINFYKTVCVSIGW